MDDDNKVYPGKFPDGGDEYFDSNCNFLEGRVQDPGNSNESERGLKSRGHDGYKN